MKAHVVVAEGVKALSGFFHTGHVKATLEKHIREEFKETKCSKWSSTFSV